MEKKLIITPRDIIKGYTTKANSGMSPAYEMTPWQMLDLKDKTDEWKMWVADYFEYVGLKHVRENYKKIIKTRRLASGILDIEDYSPVDGEFAHLTKWVLPEELSEPFKKFHPLIPPYIKVLDGEFLKRNLQIFVTCTDRQSEDDKLEYKNNMVSKAIIDDAVSKKDKALKELGISQTSDSDLKNANPQQVQQLQQQNQQYQSEIEAAKQLATAEQKYKKYRHRFEEFGQLVLDKDYERFHMAELEREAFIETLCNAKQCWHIDMLEDSYKVEMLDNAQVFNHKSPNIKYYSDGDYMGWFEDMTIGDIINKLGKKLKSADFDTFKKILEDFSSNNSVGGGRLLTTQEEGWQGARYDTTKPYPLGRTNVPMEQYWQQENIRRLNDNTQGMSSAELSSIFNRTTSFASPKMFRVMRLYFRSQRKVGWLTKKERDGTVSFQDWVDENFIVTVPAVYDNSMTILKNKENLAYGEHIDWEWGNEWRHVIKINNNTDHTFWRSQAYGFDPIYIDGERIQFQFSGTKDNPMDVFPPFEGVEYRMRQVRTISFVDLLAPGQITYNIAMNRVPDIMFQDVGMVMAFNKAIINVNRPGLQAGVDPIDDWLDNLRTNKIAEVNIDADILRTQGNAAPLMPQILNYSRIKEGIDYLTLARMIKEDSGQIVGISPQRLAQAKASETATGVNSNINYSETQTEPYFHQHIVEFMPRVYTRMLEAAQYYCTYNETARAAYQTSTEGNKFLEIENMEGIAPTYNIKCTSDIKESVLKDRLTQLFMNNNTTDATILDLAQGLASDNPQQILEQLRKSQIDKEQKDQQKYDNDQAAQKAQQDAMDKHEKHLEDIAAEQAQLDRESHERIALTRALGGIQTDVNANKVPDALDNMNIAIKNKQLLSTVQSAQDKLAFAKVKHSDDTSLKRENMIIRQSVEQKKLAVALANAQKADDKVLNRKIAKDQGIIK